VWWGRDLDGLVGDAWVGGCLDALEDWARGLTQARFLGHADMQFDRGGLLSGRSIGLPERIEDFGKSFLTRGHGYSDRARGMVATRSFG